MIKKSNDKYLYIYRLKKYIYIDKYLNNELNFRFLIFGKKFVADGKK